VGTRARPSGVTIASLAQSRTGGAACASRMPIVSTKPSSQLLLAQLFRFVQSNNDCFLLQDDAVHRMHRSGSLIGSLE